jgi:hypothetical protein
MRHRLPPGGASLAPSLLTSTSRTPPWLLSEWGCRGRRLSRGRRSPDKQSSLWLYRPAAHRRVLNPSAPESKAGWWRPRRDVPVFFYTLRSHFSDYGDTGFQASQVIFPTEGCWQVTGTVGDSSVTFVTRVVKLPGLKANVASPKS